MSIPDRIIIREIDATTVQQPALPMDVAYVPGFAGQGGSNDSHEPYLCTTLSEFKEQFGTLPKRFDTKQEIEISTTSTNVETQYIWEETSDVNGGNLVIVAPTTSTVGEVGDKLTLDISKVPDTTPKAWVLTSIEEVPVSEAVSKTITICEAGDWDKAYIYAAELLAQGLPVYYQAVEATTVADLYAKLSAEYDASIFKAIQDKGEYTIKYITSGGYPTYFVGATELSDCPAMKNMLRCATSRADSIAFITPEDDNTITLVGADSVLVNVQKMLTTDELMSAFGGVYTAEDYPDGEAERIINYAGSNATMLYPWYDARLIAMGATLPIYDENGNALKNKFVEEISMPADFSYLFELARSIRTNPSWMAIAGVTRGLVTNIEDGNNTYPLHTKERLTNTIADIMQPEDKVAINAITNIRPYGYTIWGNRTLFDNSFSGGLVASSFLNIRNLVCDIKKTLYVACKSLMFEQNTSILWVNFKSQITPLLDQMVSGGGIAGYKIKRIPTNKRGKVVASVTIYPIYAVESFDITVIITDSDVTVVEE